MCVDAEGALWYLDGDIIRRCSADGTPLDQKIQLPEDVTGTAVAVTPDGRLLIADAGWREQIRVYENITDSPELQDTFGETGGIYAGDTPGRHGPMRFLGPIGVGADNDGNIYVAHAMHAEDYIMDICHAINAYQRDNGEYIVFIEDDARSKNVMFRWRPDSE